MMHTSENIDSNLTKRPEKSAMDTSVIRLAIICVLGCLAMPLQPVNSQEARFNQVRSRLLMQDSDNDGVTDIVERSAGTNPNSPDEYPLKRMSFWKFDDTALPGSATPSPRRSVGAEFPLGIDGTALHLSETTQGACFNIRYQESDGQIHMAPSQGSIIFFFKPNWDSGRGPQAIAPLVATGLWTADARHGYWGLTLTPDGKELFLGIQKNGATYRLLKTSIQWKAGQWYQIRLSYSAQHLALFIDGTQVATQGPGAIALTPDPNLLKEDGIDLLCDRYGASNAKGSIDELEIYNYVMGLNNSKARYDNLVSASATVDPAAIHLTFPNIQNRPLNLSRRTIDSSTWTSLKKDWQANSYLDRSIIPGEIYEYKITPAFSHNHSTYLDRLVIASAGARTKDPDGILAVIVDETIESRIQNELDISIQNWIEDGWQPRIIKAPRHNDDGPQTVNTQKVLELKSRIKDLNISSGGQLRAIVIIGHVVVPYSGRLNPDGHYYRPWEVDFYYGDLDGDEKWTDREQDSDQNPGARIAGDGIWDQFKFPTPLEVPVGRIDFSNLPVFRESETELISDYLKKAVKYREGELVFPATSAGFCSFPNVNLHNSTYLSLTRNAGPLFGDSLENIFEVNFFKRPEAYRFGVQLGAGSYDTISNGNPSHVVKSIDFARNRDLHRTAFMSLDGSYFGQWNTRNNFLRSSITVNNGGLAAFWGRHLMVRMHWLGAGLTIGESLMNNINSLTPFDGNAGFSNNIFIQLMGDPTLHLFPSPPLESVSIRSADQNGFNTSLILEWNKSDAPVFIEVSKDGLNGKFSPLYAEPVTGESITIPDSFPANTVFRLRKVVLKPTGSGLWTFLSHGKLVRKP